MDIYNLVFQFEAETPVSFQQYPGITLRGGLGLSMKRSLCVMGRGCDNCVECVLSETCAYARVFESISTGSDERMKKATNYPHPFVLTPLFSGPVHFNKGDEFGISLTIIGSGIKYLPYMVHSLVKLGENGAGRERGRFRLKGIMHGGDNSLLSINAAGLDYKKVTPLVFGKPAQTSRAEIEFTTPCRIRKNGRAIRNADFAEIIKSIIRKKGNLGALYGDEAEAYDRSDLLDKADAVKKISEELRWEKLSRYSKRQENRMPLEGFTGTAVYEGDIAPFHELLKTAELVNIGKNSSFGFGAVRVNFF